VWSIGVIVVQMMLGEYPFEASTPFELFTAIRQGLAAALEGLETDNWLLEIVKGACELEPVTRLSVRDIVTRLNK